MYAIRSYYAGFDQERGLSLASIERTIGGGSTTTHEKGPSVFEVRNLNFIVRAGPIRSSEYIRGILRPEHELV